MEELESNVLDVLRLSPGAWFSLSEIRAGAFGGRCDGTLGGSQRPHLRGTSLTAVVDSLAKKKLVETRGLWTGPRYEVRLK